jgi:hypothetical protein
MGEQHARTGLGRHRVTVSYDDIEWARIQRAAGDQSPGAWIGAVSARVAAGERGLLPPDWQDTIKALVTMRREQLELRREVDRAHAALTDMTVRLAEPNGTTPSAVPRLLDAMSALLERMSWQSSTLEGIIALARHQHSRG